MTMRIVKLLVTLLVAIPVILAIVNDHAVHFEFHGPPQVKIYRSGRGFDFTFIGYLMLPWSVSVEFTDSLESLVCPIHFTFEKPPVFTPKKNGVGFLYSFYNQMGWIYIEFFGKLNKPFNGTDDREHIYGAFVRKPLPDATIQWTYNNNYTRLKTGDVIHFWIRALRMDYTASEFRYGYINVTL